jgi:hypothetical protein
MGDPEASGVRATDLFWPNRVTSFEKIWFDLELLFALLKSIRLTRQRYAYPCYSSLRTSVHETFCQHVSNHLIEFNAALCRQRLQLLH